MLNYGICINCGKRMWFWQKVDRLFFEGWVHVRCSHSKSKRRQKNKMDERIDMMIITILIICLAIGLGVLLGAII